MKWHSELVLPVTVTVIFTITFLVVPAVSACTRILWNPSDSVTIVGRTMDWAESTQPKLWVFPRGIQRDGGMMGPVRLIHDRPARWKSKYGSVVVSGYDLGSFDGMNEQGLGMHLLFLTATDYGVPDDTKDGIQAGLWGQYLLDNAASVDEAIDLMKGIQPVMVEHGGFRSTLHLAIEDSSGDSAIVEYVGGNAKIYHGSQHRVMTNDPPYDQQLKELSKWDFSDATRKTPLPGNVNPIARFVRANYFLESLRKPRSEREAIASVLSIARNASVPFNAPYKTPGTIYDTEYRTVADLAARRYFFELTTSPNVIWIDLNAFDLREGGETKTLDPNDIHLSGSVESNFQVVDQPPF
ncbi:linear amide C-N hydrolase [Crateriforma conspicua]|uniref:linear amide C-N hydrolase n=1 Tax=Crateriforma conspicua TaxID=2527996 RepID=UPI001188B9F6|nr:linear amide C-N hydrolase [Crateriforma conspicua]QDV61476.1 Penicillin acylase precursor [Crateriforma conspicua]